jgi:hypothetical protein
MRQDLLFNNSHPSEPGDALGVRLTLAVMEECTSDPFGITSLSVVRR